MIEITTGFTSICAGSDPVSREAGLRRPTGARVTMEFCRDTPLTVGQAVRAHYEFVGGQSRTAIGVATPTRTESLAGRLVFHYRLSHWIEPAALSGGLPMQRRDDPLGSESADDRIPA